MNELKIPSAPSDHLTLSPMLEWFSCYLGVTLLGLLDN